MTDRPILFSAPMVRALLAGTKTQTRRVLKPRPMSHVHDFLAVGWDKKSGKALWETRHDGKPTFGISLGDGLLDSHVATIAVGDRLWVKETWRTTPAYDDLKPSDMGGDEPLNYLADDSYFNWAEADGARHGKTRVSIFMPRWASRLTLTVTDVRVERLQDISEADAIAEGVEPAALTDHWKDYGPDPMPWASPVESYRSLWDSINGAGAWAANPFVVAVSFDVREGNIDA